MDTVGRSIQKSDDLSCGFTGQGIAAEGIQIVTVDYCFRLVILTADLRLKFRRNIIDPFRLHTQHYQTDGAGSGDRVILSPALQFCDANGHQFLDTAKELSHDLVGIGTVLVDLHTGVAALQAVHRQLNTRTVNHTALHRQMDGTPCAAGTGNGENTLVLRIQIHKGSALQHGKIHAGSALHTDLLIHSDDDLQRRMGNGFVCQQRQCICHRNTVVAAKGGSLGKHALTVMGHIQPLIVHIDGTISILLTDHIHMALQDHGCMILHTAGALLKEDHIIQFVLNIADPMLYGKGNQIIADHLRVTRSMRNGTDFFKVTKNRSRLQTCQLNCVHNQSLLHER